MRSMPSPTGKNLARLTLPDTFPSVAGPLAAYDEKTEAGQGLVEFLRSKLSPEDFTEFCRLAKIDDDAEAMDDESELDERMPMPKTDAQAHDQARARLALRVARTPGAASFAERYPGAAKIKV